MTRHAPFLLILALLTFAVVENATATDRHREGVISHMGDGFPASYLALPIGRGYTVRLCGPLGCVTQTSNDVGPHQGIHPDRIADVSVATFRAICGDPSVGLCRGSWTLVRDAAPGLPATDTE